VQPTCRIDPMQCNDDHMKNPAALGDRVHSFERGWKQMKSAMSRRRFVTSTAAVSLSTLAIGAEPVKPAGSKKPIIVSSGNGLRAVEKAMELVRTGHDPLDAAIEGVAIVEADPKDHSVGYGGLPNEDGVVELDAAVMHGPTHRGGSVAAIRNIMHPAAVARLVMQRTRHCLLVGEGALRFARAHGFPEIDLLTEESRQIWLHWKESRDPKDDWLPPPDEKVASTIREALANRVTGTIHCSVLDSHGDLGCTTSTSGLSWKIPGRVGDSPILGAGLYLDNEVGSAGSTGVGELNLLNLSSALIVEGMRRGLHPKDAIMEVCKTIATRCIRDPKRRAKDGRLVGNVSFYAVSKDGRFAGGSIYPGGKMSVHDGEQARVVLCDPLFAK
jgi:N4-(beta-N-acetylglucosaminyl)-L-asparaginase